MYPLSYVGLSTIEAFRYFHLRAVASFHSAGYAIRMSNLSKNHADWLKRAAKVRKRHNTIDEADHEEYREAAGELWRLLYEAPDTVKIAYRNLLESTS